MLGEGTIEKSEEQVVDPHRDVETPCFVKDTVRDGFFTSSENINSKHGARLPSKTERKNTYNLSIRKESMEDT